jgi:transcriptional regulator with PAS, ATPase and Fis domain
MFVEKYNNILGTNITNISQQAQDALIRHCWPGNIRELENAIERAANYIWEGEIGVEHLPSRIFQSDHTYEEQSSYRVALNDVDREIIIEALNRANGNKSAAARLLKISSSAFYDKLAKYGVN